MKYSFLVCAYNAEKYLRECLDSLVNQTISKDQYEIVLVNDGSTDKTEEIARSYKNVKVINQKNIGLPGARNTALNNSDGEWIVFIDADDYVSANYLEEISKVAVGDTNFIKIWEKKQGEAEKADKKVQSNKIDDSIVSRAFKRNLLGKYQFPSKYKFAIEDWDFYVHNYHKLKTKDISNKKTVFYFYRYTEGSLSKTNNIYFSRFDHAISIFENKKLRDQNLGQNIIGHYWEHLYMVAKLWFPELMPRVEKIKYKVKVRPSIKFQYFIVKIGIFNYFIRKSGKPIKK